MSAATASVLVAALGVLVVILTGLLGFAVKTITRTTTNEVRLAEITKQLEKIVQDKDNVHKELIELIRQTQRELAGQIKEDRVATSKRLLYLEREVWPRQRQGRD